MTVFVDPFREMTPMLDHGLRWDYPAIDGAKTDLSLVTHERLDHDGVELVGGGPVTLRSTAGRLESPIGEVMGTASEHDGVAGTERNAHTLFVFNLAGRLVAHLGESFIVPTHYKPSASTFSGPSTSSPSARSRAERVSSPAFELEGLPAGDTPLVIVPATP
jgi:Beta-lactamase superfamily domain